MTGKPVVLLALLFVSYFAVISPSFSKKPVRVYVDPTVVVDPDVLFNVSVNLENLVNLVGLQWELTWDPTLLRCVEMTEIMFHEVTPESEWDNIWRLWHTIDNGVGKAGYAYLWWSYIRAVDEGYGRPISGNRTAAIISFQVLGIGNCTLQLTRSWTKLCNPDSNAIRHELTDGFFSNTVPPESLPLLPSKSSEALIYVDPSTIIDESLTVGETFTVKVKMDSLINHPGIFQSHFQLSWNSTLLDCINVTEVMFHEAWPKSEWQNIEYGGSVWPNDPNSTIALCTGPSFSIPTAAEFVAHLIPSGNHTLATITFRVKNTGNCRLHLFDCRPFEYTGIGMSQMICSMVDGYFANEAREGLADSSVRAQLEGLDTWIRPVPHVASRMPISDFACAHMSRSAGMLSLTQMAPRGESQSESQRRSAVKVPEVPFGILGMLSSMFVALAVYRRRTRKDH